MNVEVERNLLAACEAIRTGKPTRQYYHCQITPDRWIEMHGYLVGIQRWLACGSEYFVIEQDDQYGRDPFDCLITSRDNLIEMGYRDWFARD